MSPESEYRTQTLEEYFERRAELLADIDYRIVRRAWFTLAHLLLNENAHVADMGCDDGELTYCMAALAPNINFYGIDKSKRQINKAKELYESKVHNLEFICADASVPFQKEGTYDAILNSNVLHEVYSGSRYSEKIVSETLRNQFKMLKEGGTLYIADYARPPPEEYVLMELPDISGYSDDLLDMSDTELLIWYSEHARPRQDAGCGGFFLEELPPRFPRTRLFRLPYKWAYEFIMRKDDRETWDKTLPVEFTYFTEREFRKELRGLGARVQYSAPVWDEDMIDNQFEGHFRLYKTDGTQLGYPPTGFIAVAQKMKERQSLLIGERRPSYSDNSSITISAMRNDVNGEIVDIISRAFTPAEVLPYAINAEGRLKIYLHDGIPRGMANTVPRYGSNIDGKRWSGHMIEALTVDATVINELTPKDVKDAVKFSRDYLGLKPRGTSVLIDGPEYYPAPDYIDERIKTYFLNVERNKQPVRPKNMLNMNERYQAKGEIREFDAQQVLNSIQVGMLPNARLELQILSLFEYLNLKPESWTSKQVNIQKQEISQRAQAKNLLQKIKQPDGRFKGVRGSAGQLRTVHSIFVEEGQTQGATTGLSSENMDFVVSDEKTINTAIVIPLTKGIKDDLHAGVMVDYLPVPQRHEGNGLTMHAPSFNIPSDVTNLKQMKKFIADQFALKPENVIKLGESYFSHIGLTQHRIYPFAIAAPPQAFGLTGAKFIPFHQYRLLWSSLSKDTHFMVVLARAWKMLSSDIKNDYKMRVKEIVKDRFSGKVSDWSIPMTYAPPPGKNTGIKQEPQEPEIKKKKKRGDSTSADQEPPELAAMETSVSEAPRQPQNGALPFHHRLAEGELLEREKTEEKPEEKAKAKPSILIDVTLPQTAVVADTGLESMDLEDDFQELDELASYLEDIDHDDNAPSPKIS